MKEVEYFFWMMPPDAWRKKPSPSRWKMTREEAAKLGLTEPVLSSREARQIAETDEERTQMLRANSTAAFRRNWDQGKPPDNKGSG